MVWVSIIIGLVMAVVGELLRPKPKFNDPKPSAVGDFSFPTADASRVIPVFFGTCKLQGPNTVWFGDLEVVTLKKKVKTGWFSSKKITTGFNYYLGVQLVFSYGPVDEFLELRVDDKPVDLRTGEGGWVQDGFARRRWVDAPYSDKQFVGGVCSFNIDAPTVLGNDDPPNGVRGACKLYQGTFTQPPNLYLSAQWNEPDMSAFRPLFYMVMEKCYLGNTDTPPPIAAIARRCPNQLGLTGGRHNVNGDANIACAVYEVMTNNLWGMKVPEDKIDRDSFVECGNILADEALGISMLIQTAMLGKDLVAEMLRHADGVIYADPVTGLYTMALAREIPEDERDDLLVIDDSNILPDTFEFSRTSWEMTKNTIIVQYTDRRTFDTKPVQYQDLANIDVRGGMIDSEEFSYLGFSNEVAAMNTAARVSKMKASPLVSSKMSVNRIGYQLRPGSAFWLRKPNRGLANILMRVIEISYGTLDDPAIELTAMEDIFEVNAVAYVPPGPGDWTPPVGPLAPLAHQRLIEAPFFGSDDESRRYAITLGVSGANSTMAYDVWTDTTGEYVQTNAIDSLTPSGVLVSAYPSTGPEVDSTGFIVTAIIGLSGIEPGEPGSREGGENLVLIGDELLAWETITSNGDGTFTVAGVYRGVLDTMPESHASGARVFFLSEGAGTTNEEGYGGDAELRVKLTPKSIAGTVALSEAAEMTITLDSRAQRPLPPGRLRINGNPVPALASYSGDVPFAWAHRNRFSESVVPQSAPSQTPEEGTTYNVRVVDSADQVVAEVLGVSSAASVGVFRLAVSGSMRLEIEAVRDGLVSWTKLSGAFEYTSTGATGSEIIIDEPEYVLDGGGA